MPAASQKKRKRSTDGAEPAAKRTPAAPATLREGLETVSAHVSSLSSSSPAERVLSLRALRLLADMSAFGPVRDASRSALNTFLCAGVSGGTVLVPRNASKAGASQGTDANRDAKDGGRGKKEKKGKAGKDAAAADDAATCASQQGGGGQVRSAALTAVEAEAAEAERSFLTATYAEHLSSQLNRLRGFKVGAAGKNKGGKGSKGSKGSKKGDKNDDDENSDEDGDDKEEQVDDDDDEAGAEGETAERALRDLIALARAEAQYDGRVPAETLERITSALVESRRPTERALATMRAEVMRPYEDARVVMLGAIKSAVGHLISQVESGKEPAASAVSSVFALLVGMPCPEGGDGDGDGDPEDSDAGSEASSRPGARPKFAEAGPAPTAEESRKAFGACWLSFLRLPLPPTIFKEVLKRLHTEVMPHLTRPHQLLGFLQTSYSMGGVISVLALDGLFVLITEHNLDYPDFFDKTYALLDPAILRARYCGRFLRLLHGALRTSYVPVYLVTAFVKKLARLALTAPPRASLAVMAIIHNVMIKHKGAQKLIDRDPVEDTTGNDPFDAETTDPKACGASESSLWELHSLTKHYNRQVSQFARKFRHDIVVEASVSDILGGGTVAGYAGVFDEEAEPDVAKDKAAAFEFREQPDLLPGAPAAEAPKGSGSRNLAPRWCT